jgi:hypothetical protein
VTEVVVSLFRFRAPLQYDLNRTSLT